MLSRRLQKSLEWLDNEKPPEFESPWGPPLAMNSAENWLVRPYLLPLMKQAVSTSLEAQHLSYSKNPGGPQELLQGLSSFFNKFFSPRHPVSPDHIVIGAGASAILDSLDFATCELDDGLLIDAPIWEGFGLATNLRNDDRLVPVTRPSHLSSPEQVMQHYLKAMEAAPCRIRGIIVCNPQNPYGHIYPASWLEAILQFCESQDIHYISDEIYGMSAWGSSKERSSSSDAIVVESPVSTFTSVLSLDLKRLKVDPSRVHVIYALSKDLGSSGLRLGFMVTQKNPELRSAMWILNRYRVSCASNLMGAGVFSDLLALESILVRNRVLLRNAAETVGDFLSFHRISFYRPVAGVFVWARLGGTSATWQSDVELGRRFALASVSVAFGSAFHADEPGWFRITHALPSEDLMEGLRRIETALQTERSWRPSEKHGSANVSSLQKTNEGSGKSFGCTVM